MDRFRFARPNRKTLRRFIPTPATIVSVIALLFAMTGGAIAADKLNKDEVTVVTVTGGPIDVITPGEAVAIPLTVPTFTQKAGEPVLLSATILVTYTPSPESGDPAFSPCDLFVDVFDSATSSYYVSDVGLKMRRLGERGDYGDLNDSGAIPAPTSDTLRTLTVLAEKRPNPDAPCDTAEAQAQVHTVSVRVSIVTYRN